MTGCNDQTMAMRSVMSNKVQRHVKKNTPIELIDHMCKMMRCTEMEGNAVFRNEVLVYTGVVNIMLPS